MAYTNETLPKQEFDSNIPHPAMIKIGDKHFIVPLWVEVTEEFNIDKAISDGLIVNTAKYKPKVVENQWPIEGSTGNLYTVKFNSSGSYECDCMGFRRAKDGKCKHVKQVISENC
jgi:hypothetical protein|tara:strand:+ start:289 stop:633 length:345 start_codon:yes stop_codon:yes gene_type:complete